ncbi:UNVERIFIED_CONTAM: hypothetical protein RMT77_000967 [Armadillidium vulgare]
MDWKVSSPRRHETTVRKKKSFTPKGSELLSQKKVEMLNYKDPMRIAQNMKPGIERSRLSNYGDCVSLAMMNSGSPTVQVQCMRVMATELELAVPYNGNGYQLYCPPSDACFLHEGRNIFIIQDDPELFISSEICDTNKNKMRPKHTMKSHVLNPEAKEFIPFNFREPQPNSKLLSVDVNYPVSGFPNKSMEYINARDELFPCSDVASEDFKIGINSCSRLSPEQAPLIIESTDSNNKSMSACTCPVSSNLNDREQTTKVNNFASDNEQLLMHALSECLSHCQLPENELKVPMLCTINSESESKFKSCTDVMNSDLCKSKPLVNPCRVKEEESCVVEKSICSKNESCEGEEPNSFGDENIEDTRYFCDRNHIKDKNKQSSKDQNLESDDDNIVFVACDEETDISDDDYDSEEESSEDEIAESSAEEESSDEENDKGINESDDDDDDITICFTVDNTQESDIESDVEDDSDFENKEQDDDKIDNDYACDLFQVEFNDGEFRIPMDGLGLVLADLLSQTTSCTPDEMVDILNNSNELDDVDSSGFMEEREEILQANKRWNEAIDLNCCSCTPTKVKFSDDVEIYSVDDFCRKGPWEVCARDRMRFQRRIEETESILSPILSLEHRRKILNRLQSMEKI